MLLQPVILSGGAGTRLWPLSRELCPKQFLAFLGDESLFQETVRRLDGLQGKINAIAAPLVVCNQEHRFLVAEQLRHVHKSAEMILLEPVGRNTAPALTVAAIAAQAKHKEDDVLLLVLPADHVIADVEKFHQAVAVAAELAAQDRLVTFGIVPTKAETGYGYIRKGRDLGHGAATIAAFVEKPDQATAGTYLQSGDYLWNSGMFVMRAGLWLQQIEQHAPAIARAARLAYDQAGADLDFCRLDAQAFTACPSDSIDYAVMEKLGKDGDRLSAVVPLAAGWSDLGVWSALWEVAQHDAQGNTIQGDVMTQNSRNNLFHAEHRLVAGVGIENLLVVETADAVLVAHRDHAQDVKKVVEQLKADNRQERLTHRQVFRPWGSYEGVVAGERFQVKRIEVNPGAQLSLQMHHHRAEHWIVVKGTARVTRGDEVFLLTENQSTYIPIGEKHRLENPGTLPLEIIEVQSGSYLGEDDIVRFEDRYGRNK